MSSSDSPEAFFRTRLKSLRETAGYTQEELAELAGISWKYLQAIEHGRRPNLSLKVIGGISKAFGLGIHEFFSPDIPKLKVKRKPRSTPHGKGPSKPRTRKGE